MEESITEEGDDQLGQTMLNQDEQRGHPAGLYLLFFTEAWERFSYYGMRAIFALFMVNALLFDKSFASSIYGSYTGLVYLTPLIGGYVADRYWGNRKSIIWGGILMAIGQFLMFASGSVYKDPTLAPLLMYTALGFIIFGNGFFKPNISTMVGQLYRPGDKRVDAAFSIFYMGINLGAFIAPLVCGILGEVYDSNGNNLPEYYKWGFLCAGLGMVLSLIIFITLKNKYIVTPEGVPIGGIPERIAPHPTIEKSPSGNSMNAKSAVGWIALALGLLFLFKGILAFDLIGSIIFSCCLVAPAFIISDKSLSTVERRRIWVIYIVAFFVIFFWSAFEQAGASLTFFAQEQTDRYIGAFDWTVPASLFQSINPVAIVIFAPIFAVMWTGLGKRNREPSSLTKQAIGLLLLALGYVVIAFTVKDLDPAIKVSMIWVILMYLIMTFGELCLSPIGLSMVVKLAPLRFASLLMGVWFLSTATANKFAGILSELYPEEVKSDYSIEASKFTILENGQTRQIVVTDSASIAAIPAGAVVTVDRANSKSDEMVKEELPFLEQIKVNLFGSGDKESKDSVLTLAVEGSYQGENIPEHKLKQITDVRNLGKNRLFHNAAGDRAYILKPKGDGGTFESWNLNPVKPSFLSFPIKDLYDFFMIFVFMSGIASILLFILVPRLLKMMGGLR